MHACVFFNDIVINACIFQNILFSKCVKNKSFLAEKKKIVNSIKYFQLIIFLVFLIEIF